MINDVIYNDVRASDLGILVLSMSPPVKAARRMTAITVPGRDGDLHIDEGSYAPTQKMMRILVKEPGGVTAANAWLAHSGILRDEFEPDVFYKVTQSAEIIWLRVSQDMREAEVLFSCDPFRYLYPEAPEIVLTTPGAIENPGTMHSAPLITVLGSGAITLTVGNTINTFENITPGIAIDSELKLAYNIETGQFVEMGAVFPMIETGEIQISWTGDVESVSILPRWRHS